MMELSTRPSGRDPSCYTPHSDHHHRFENRYDLAGTGGPRQPLEESTGNAQLRATQTLPSTGRHYGSSRQQSLDAYGAIQSSIPTPPIIPSQAFPSVYGPPVLPSDPRVPQRRRTDTGFPYYSSTPTMLQQMTRNPLANEPQFVNYRRKQDEKLLNGNQDLKDQKWPDILEVAMLDALLLIPLYMGRRKVIKKMEPDEQKSVQFGRNMLIEKYLWIYYVQSLPPGVKPDESMRRDRKKIMSHIQVEKDFFKHHPTYHYMFTSKEKPTKPSAGTAAGRALASSKEAGSIDNLSFHPVIYALNENRLPVERPNYEYFAQLLSDQHLVLVRPKRCWLFVAHDDYVVTGHEGPPDEDGNPGEMTFTAHNQKTGDELARPEDYPYLRENMYKDSWTREERAHVPSALLHQFTKIVEQAESTCVREMKTQWMTSESQWANLFPDLAARLDLAVAESGGELQEPGILNPDRCEMLNMHMTMELHRLRRFPANSELHAWVEINVEQPHLLNHRWKVVTRLMRPAELLRGDDRPLVEMESPMGVQYVHRPGCESALSSSRSRDCDCLTQRCRRQVVTVPFPADVAARTLTTCAEYRAHSLIPAEPDELSAANEKKEGRGGRSRNKKKSLTQMDLLPRVSMVQEIFSCAPAVHDGRSDSDTEDEVLKPQWKRRSCIIWTFETNHTIGMVKDKETNKRHVAVLTTPPKTTWRFLTALDPASRHHQQRSMVIPDHAADSLGMSVPSAPPTTRHSTRDTIQSPMPSYQQQLSAGMSENLSTVWDIPTTRGNSGIFAFSGNQGAYHQSLYQTALTTSSAGPGGLSILPGHDHPHAGLATPPPTSSLPGSFAHSFDNSSQQQHDPSMSFMSVASSSTNTDPYLGAGTAATNPYSTFDEVSADHSFQTWVTASHAVNGVPAIDTRMYTTHWQPQAQYASRTSSQSCVLGWAGPSPHDSPIDGGGAVIKTENGRLSNHPLDDKWKPRSTTLISDTWGSIKPPSPMVSGDNSPRPMTGCSRRESQETQGSWMQVSGSGRTPGSELSHEWEIIEKMPEGGVVSEETLLDVGYYQQPLGEDRIGNGQNGRKSPKRRRDLTSDYNMMMPSVKMQRRDRGGRVKKE